MTKKIWCTADRANPHDRSFVDRPCVYESPASQPQQPASSALHREVETEWARYSPLLTDAVQTGARRERKSRRRCQRTGHWITPHQYNVETGLYYVRRLSRHRTRALIASALRFQIAAAAAAAGLLSQHRIRGRWCCCFIMLSGCSYYPLERASVALPNWQWLLLMPRRWPGVLSFDNATLSAAYQSPASTELKFQKHAVWKTIQKLYWCSWRQKDCVQHTLINVCLLSLHCNNVFPLSLYCTLTINATASSKFGAFC